MPSIENSRDIYNYLDKNILDIISTLKLDSGDEKLQETKLEVLKVIDYYKQEKLDKAIKDLKDSQEWDKFTVAFYGETNAGKSTIIESLRIHFKEEHKYIQQQKFKIFLEEYNQQKNLFTSQLEAIKNEISDNEKKSDQLSIDFKDKKEQSETKLEQIVSEDLRKKENSIFYKMLSALRIISIQKEIDKINRELSEIKIKYNEESKAIDDSLKNQNTEIEKLKTNIEKLETYTLDLLQGHSDGQIIGDGSSDFTKKSTIYDFKHNNQEFSFLDVPGIEGNETIVIDEISSAVKKAHAVFYVTSSSTPPQKGDENKKGTLEKIKEHLGSQTEIYAIFNKRITNPMQLSKTLISDDEKESLKIVDEKITEILGESYAGHKIISAKIAFLALAECLLEKSSTYSEKKKFLDKFSTNELLEKSNFANLCKFIADELVVNTKQKIKKSNYNKASDLLNELIEILDKVSKNNFEPLYKQIDQEVKVVSENLRTTLKKGKRELDSVILKPLRDFENDTRKEIYRRIDENLNNDTLKVILEVCLEFNSKKMVEDIQKNIQTQMDKFQSSTTESLENFKRRVDLAMQDYQTLDFGNFNSKFAIDLKIDNGISGWGLAGSMMGAGATVYWAVTAGNIWNPAGWTMVTLGIVVSAVAVLVSFGKSIFNFFNNNYKMAEQRKAFDENIERVLENIEPKILENINPIKDKLTSLIDEIIDDLKSISSQRRGANELIKTTHRELVQVAKQIKLEGDR